MDDIRVGLDFGTHQTKICVQTIPDEGHGEPMYEFFEFEDLAGSMQYFLPSVMQINDDDTLSYGYVDSDRLKRSCPKPVMEEFELEIDNSMTADELYEKYATSANTIEDKSCLVKMLEAKDAIIAKKKSLYYEYAEKKYKAQIEEYNSCACIFKYFKQAIFAGREWKQDIDCRRLSIWYLSYVIFLLEEKYGTNFSINMGIPADSRTFHAIKALAVEILASAYYLVEEVYNNDIKLFLAETVDQLKSKTVLLSYSEEIKDNYAINIFPEAYAGMLPLTSNGKLSNGMSITVDIGGGTTDISFFTIQKNKPTIYKYWSIPRGLNYIAEQSGFDYASGSFSKMVNHQVVELYNRKLLEVSYLLKNELSRNFSAVTQIPKANLHKALQDRIVVYNGGGSTYKFLTKSIGSFTDVKLVDTEMWREVNMKNLNRVAHLSRMLTTAYGLSLGESDDEVKLCPLDTLFDGFAEYNKEEIIAIDKDMC